ncbi:hypothetical protein Pelo_13056 [Pelomyxa schiedti]|nr:hypothetical protein Pelo_13056 [Pelomyxa schiedti]
MTKCLSESTLAAFGENWRQNSKCAFRSLLWHGFSETLEPPKDLAAGSLATCNLLAKFILDIIEQRHNTGVLRELEMLKDLVNYVLGSWSPENSPFFTVATTTVEGIANIFNLPELVQVMRLLHDEVVVPDGQTALQLLGLAHSWEVSHFLEPKPGFLFSKIHTAVKNFVKSNTSEFLLQLQSPAMSEVLKKTHVQQHFDYCTGRISGGSPSTIRNSIMKMDPSSNEWSDSVWSLLPPSNLIQLLVSNNATNLSSMLELVGDVDTFLKESVTQGRLRASVADWNWSQVKAKPFPEILSTELLATSTIPAITEYLLKYLGFSNETELCTHFWRHKMITEAQNIGAVIKGSFDILQERHVSKNLVAARLMSLFLAQKSTGCNYRGEQVPESEHPDLIQKAVDRASSICGVEPSSVMWWNSTQQPAMAPFKVSLCFTMGHHGDVFHPENGMSSYYLKSDYVGGSADCIVVNTLIAPAQVQSWTPEEMSKLLVERLNKPRAGDWESLPGVVYCSDMAPYLIRVGCLFEGQGMRYAIDTLKLLQVLSFC